MEKLHERLHLCADSKGVNMSEVARDLGIPSGSVSRYFSGTSTPKVPELYKLATYFGVSMEWLYKGAEARPLREMKVGEEEVKYLPKKRLSEEGKVKILEELEKFKLQIEAAFPEDERAEK